MKFRKPTIDGAAPDRQVQRRRVRVRRRILRSTAILPGMFTISNALAGFGAIHFATKEALGAVAWGNLSIAAWLIFVAMVADMLDGRVARMTRRTSDFGGQLDSLSDIVSFGVAPAVLMLRTVVMAMREMGVGRHLVIERMVWCVAGVYLACGALRLARFNVENDPDESSHMDFLGLPIPGAAAVVAAMVLLSKELVNGEWTVDSDWLMPVISIVLPVGTLVVGLLMVSRFSYPHIINQYVRGKRPFGYLVKLVLIGLAAMVAPWVTGAALTFAYALSGPARACWKLVLGKKTEPADESPANKWTSAPDDQ